MAGHSPLLGPGQVSGLFPPYQPHKVLHILSRQWGLLGSAFLPTRWGLWRGKASGHTPCLHLWGQEGSPPHSARRDPKASSHSGA